MKKFLWVLALAAFANAQPNKQANKQPKLVVGVVVDQMKMEYLYRFADDFTNNGFKRIMRDGFTFHNMHYNYMPTFTAPGHASVYTGTTPATHGIVGNDWFNKSIGKEMYCTDDADAKTLVPGTEKEGAMSPKNLLTTTITDELKLATNFKGKVIGVSIKDRGAILPAGHFADWAFWFAKNGDFISSSFYGNQLPAWVTQFNAEKNYLSYIKQGWNLLKPASTYNESLPDDNPYEGKIDKSKAPVFPYDLNKLYNDKGADVLRTTPFGNDLLADFAMKAVQNENLGKDNITDFLAVSFSSTDYVGHTFGPRAMELQDTYLRLDITLAKFMDYLDANVGKDNYILFLTADHAGAENPNFLKDNKYAVKNFSSKEIEKGMGEFLTQTFGENLLLDFSNANVFLNKKRIQEKGLELNKVKLALKDYLMSLDNIRRVYTEDEILSANGSDYYLNFIVKGYDAKQNGELVVLDRVGYMPYQATGTTHGSPNSYDTHVPFLIYGTNIPKGASHDKKAITQIAPTLSQILKIPFTNGTESNPLTEVIK